MEPGLQKYPSIVPDPGFLNLREISQLGWEIRVSEVKKDVAAELKELAEVLQGGHLLEVVNRANS
jgi:hypothetical protein